MELYFEDYEGDYRDLNKCDIMKISRIDLCRHTMQVGYKNRSLFLSASLYKHLELFFMLHNIICPCSSLNMYGSHRLIGSIALLSRYGLVRES